MNEFRTYHPTVNLIYFVFVIGFAMFFMHPISLAVSFACVTCYVAVLKGVKKLGKSVLYSLPLVATASVINACFNHEGITVLEYLPSGNPLTLESVIYGFSASVMLVVVILWFNCFCEIMTSDKFIYLFGRIIPSLSLILSMTLRFVPKFTEQLKKVSDSQKCIGKSVSDGSYLQKAKNGLAILSIMITWALENATDTADSMKSRGYGLHGRTAFSIFKFNKRDMFAMAYIFFFGVYTLVGTLSNQMHYRYFPSFQLGECSPYSASVFVSYFLLCGYPIFTELWEVYKWKAIKSKI